MDEPKIRNGVTIARETITFPAWIKSAAEKQAFEMSTPSKRVTRGQVLREYVIYGAFHWTPPEVPGSRGASE